MASPFTQKPKFENALYGSIWSSPIPHQFSDLISYHSSSWTLCMYSMPSLLFLEHNKNALASRPLPVPLQINPLFFLSIYLLSLPLSFSPFTSLPPSLHLSTIWQSYFFQFYCQISHERSSLTIPFEITNCTKKKISCTFTQTLLSSFFSCLNLLHGNYHYLLCLFLIFYFSLQ